MSLFKKGRERTWFKVLFVVFVTWCFFGKVETSQNGLNQAKINNQIPEKTVKIKHDGKMADMEVSNNEFSCLNEVIITMSFQHV